MTQVYYIGSDALRGFTEVLQRIMPKRILLVRGNHSYSACGAEKKLDPIWQTIGSEIIEFKGFTANPKWEEAQEGLAILQHSQADCIVAVGGGSAMDMAKLIRHLYGEGKGIRIPLLAVPTTSGTGAEATHFAVVYKGGAKQSVEADDVLPDIAVVYPPFTYTNDSYLTACTGIDAIAQAIEAYWSKNATEESRRYSCKALQLLWKQLPQLLKEPTDRLRDEVAEGAYWAGRAINIAKTTAPHAFSYAFTSHYGYPHGHAVALTLPFFMEMNADDTLLAELGLTRSNVCAEMCLYIEGIGLSLEIKQEINLFQTLHEVNLQRLKNNPVEVGEEEIGRLYSYLSKIKSSLQI